jgi:hypothetical protein
MTGTIDSLPSDLAAAHALILAERAARVESQARAARAEATLSYAQATGSSAEALIARLRLEIEKLRRALYGVRSERLGCAPGGERSIGGGPRRLDARRARQGLSGILCVRP